MASQQSWWTVFSVQFLVRRHMSPRHRITKLTCRSSISFGNTAAKTRSKVRFDSKGRAYPGWRWATLRQQFSPVPVVPAGKLGYELKRFGGALERRLQRRLGYTDDRILVGEERYFARLRALEFIAKKPNRAQIILDIQERFDRDSRPLTMESEFSCEHWLFNQTPKTPCSRRRLRTWRHRMKYEDRALLSG